MMLCLSLALGDYKVNWASQAEGQVVGKQESWMDLTLVLSLAAKQLNLSKPELTTLDKLE